jgi:hypothetical protein
MNPQPRSDSQNTQAAGRAALKVLAKNAPPPWFKTYSAEVIKLQRHLGRRNKDGRGVMGTLQWLLTLMSESPKRGYLLDDLGNPITVECLARDLHSKPCHIQDDIYLLNDLGIVLHDDLQTLFSPVMAAETPLTQIRKTAGSAGGQRTQANIRQLKRAANGGEGRPDLLKQNDDFALPRVQSLEFIYTSSIDSSGVPEPQAAKGADSKNQNIEPRRVPDEPIQVPRPQPPPLPPEPPPAPPAAIRPQETPQEKKPKHTDPPPDSRLAVLPAAPPKIAKRSWFELRTEAAFHDFNSCDADWERAEAVYYGYSQEEQLTAFKAMRKLKPLSEGLSKRNPGNWFERKLWQREINPSDPFKALGEISKPKRAPQMESGEAIMKRDLEISRKGWEAEQERLKAEGLHAATA